MRVLGVAGYSGAGKTTLVTKIITALTERGMTVSTIKHAHHNFDVDTPGKDSYEHRHAGASEVLISSAQRWALMHEHRGADEPTMEQMLEKLDPVDLVLVEGWKFGDHAKLEVYRPSTGKPLLATNDPHVIAVATDELPLAGVTVPVLDLNDSDAIIEFVAAFARETT